MTGVIGHIANPTVGQAVRLAQRAERAGATWMGLADAFWWRDVWMLLAAVAGGTERIAVGPAMTNPYMRHPFHTASALATLHELAPGRVFCGITAGGSEVSAAAAMSRRDAPERTGALAQLLRDLGGGAPLDPTSGRTLDVPLPHTPVLMAARGDRMLTAAGTHADRVLLWAIPRSDLRRSLDVVAGAAAGADRSPVLVWAPLVRHPDVAERSIGHAAVYAALNSAPAIRGGWGLHDGLVHRIRRALVGGRLDDAIAAVPPAALDDLVFDPSDHAAVARTARDLGVTQLAVPGFSVDTVAGHIVWATAIETDLAR